QDEFPQTNSGLVIPSFLPGDDPIASLNKAIAFLTTAITSRFPPTNNQLRTSSNPQNKIPLKMVGLHSNKCRGDRVRVLLADDLDAYDSDCDEAPDAKAILMANLSSFDSDVISEVPILETSQDNYILDISVQKMYYSEQPTFNPDSDIEITSDSNIISYDQYLKETESAAVQNTTLTA
ncbi:hypothetical protein Tco_0148753, partial [Tanacetum coccineum]